MFYNHCQIHTISIKLAGQPLTGENYDKSRFVSKESRI